MPLSLVELGRTIEPDKASHPHYLPLYERYVTHPPGSILELGLAQGKSLLLWLAAYPAARVTGVDHRYIHCDEARANVRCTILECDQADPAILSCGPFDLVVDDAGHDRMKQRQSLEMLWPALNRGGLYAVEDLEVSYWRRDSQEGWQEPGAIVPFLKGLADRLTADYAKVDSGGFPRLDGLTAIHWHPNLVFLEKGQ